MSTTTEADPQEVLVQASLDQVARDMARGTKVKPEEAQAIAKAYLSTRHKTIAIPAGAVVKEILVRYTANGETDEVVITHRPKEYQQKLWHSGGEIVLRVNQHGSEYRY